MLSNNFRTLWALLWLCLAARHVSSGFQLYALINMNGMVGSINFSQNPQDSRNVTIVVNINTFREPGNYSWYIASNVVSYSEQDKCNRKTLGNKILDLTTIHGLLSIPTADDVIFEDSGSFRLYDGPDSIWEKSLVLESNGVTVCGNILGIEAATMAQAKFSSKIAGHVSFRQTRNIGGKLSGMTISVDLFHVGTKNPSSSVHDWNIMATDILDMKSASRKQGFCDHLTILYEPDNVNDANCTRADHVSCKKGDLVAKHGQIPVGGRRSRFSRKVFYDANLSFPNLEGSRYLYVAVYTADETGDILDCAKIRKVEPRETHAHFMSDGVKGHISFRQPSPLDPTHVIVNLTNLNELGVYYHIHMFPVPPRSSPNETVCTATGNHFNPAGVDRVQSPAPANGTYDQYETGDLSGKYGLLEGTDYFGDFVDPYLTLYDQNSIIGRSVIIHIKDGSRWICANIEYPQQMITAVATFYYPIVGRVIFRQNANDPLSETTVFVESLVYNDGTRNSTSNHKWHVYTRDISRDFYNWTKRCASAGKNFNPYRVNTEAGSNNYAECQVTNPLRCMVGDMTSKSMRLTVASSSSDVERTRVFYTDTNLPLSGSAKIIGRSLVLQDDTAPAFRGNRLACASIARRYPSRAWVNRWYLSGSTGDVAGRIEMEQAFEYDTTYTSIELRGLEKQASGFHVHEVSIPIELHFPCTNDAVYGHFNPFGIQRKLSPAPGTGSSDQYEMGDLSGKYGTLDDQDSVIIEAIDSTLPVQGFFSVIGRSVVVHKQKNDERWFCGDIRPHIKETGAQWIQAVASFHHPKGFVYGYIRFGQIEYADGSLSDTMIEVNLRYPGKNDRNITKGHEWAVYVNQVGEDAAVVFEIARCIAAGFRWNPYLVKSDREDYKNECSNRQHFACEMGDLSGRHGTLTIGSHRVIFTDHNLPLAGNYSIMKKSIVILDKKNAGQRFACANIEPDVDIVQKIQIEKLNRVTGKIFIDQVREIMAVPEWMMYLDASEYREVDKCLQFTIYFRGPDANKLQLDFDRLLNTGKVDKPYATAPGDFAKKKETPKFLYKSCSAFVNLDNGKPQDNPIQPLLGLNLLIYFMLFI